MRLRSERQNLKGILKGQRQAYEAVICQNYKSIYHFMAYLTGDTNLAEDLTQEAFASAWANIGHYKGRASLRTWLHKIAYHKFIDSRRRFKRHVTLLAGLRQGSRDVPETLNPLYRLMADEHSCLLYDAICRLEPSEHIVIVLHYIQGLSFREMSEVLGEPVGTVKWRTSRTLKKLKEILTGRV